MKRLSPADQILAYHAMRPWTTPAEAVTTAHVLGLSRAAIGRIRRAVGLSRPRQRAQPPDALTVETNANLGRAYCDASR